jgi:hypothetical protein
MKHALRAAGMVCAAALAGLLVTEALAQLWVRRVARRGKLFTTDDVLGWKPIPGLRLVRRNADGDDWLIVTDSAGWRQPAGAATGKHRLIVAGDSYAFGEGVNVADRFDSRITSDPDVAVVNHGVMGYGTDQSLLAAELARPRAGDVVMLLAYQNDVIDVLRHGFASRVKPWYEPVGDSVRLHPPAITWRERLRDRSYLMAALLAAREPTADEYRPEDWRRGLALQRTLLSATARSLARRGIAFIVAHHGDSIVARGSGEPAPYAFLDSVPGVVAVALDHSLSRCGGRIVLRDGHWNAAGHACARAALAGAVARALGDTTAEIP